VHALVDVYEHVVHYRATLRALESRLRRVRLPMRKVMEKREIVGFDLASFESLGFTIIYLRLMRQFSSSDPLQNYIKQRERRGCQEVEGIGLVLVLHRTPPSTDVKYH
jgi:hypothetical protein